MPVISTLQTSAEYLVTGDQLVITGSGELAVITTTAIQTSGSNYNIDIRVSGEVFGRNYGMLLASTSLGYVDGSGIGDYNIWVGDDGVVANAFASQDAIATWGSGNVLVTSGQIIGMNYGFRNSGADAYIDNQGTIIGEGIASFGAGIRLNGIDGTEAEIYNSGLIRGSDYGIYSSAHSLYLENSGTIHGRGGWGVFAIAGDYVGGPVTAASQTVINSGTITGGISLTSYNGSNRVVNLEGGVIIESIQLDEGNDRVENSGLIDGDVALEEGDDLLVNDGVITGTVTADTGNDVLRGTGDYDAYIYLSDGNDVFWLQGGTVLSDVHAGTGLDVMRNSGRVMGDVYLENDNDTYVGWGGAVEGTIYGGLGDDVFYVDDPHAVVDGGTGTDTVYARDDVTLGYGVEETYLLGAADANVTGNLSDELITGNGGDNAIDAGDGNDTVFGGTGADDILGGVGVDDLKGGAGSDTIDGQTGNDTVAGQSGDDELYGGGDDDLVAGNIGDDFVDGGTGDDRVLGQAGNDTLVGGTGEDVLVGGAGADLLYGGEGRDILQGKSGDDVFVFESTDDIWDGALGDRISDFESGADLIDVSGIGDESAFAFLGTGAFTAGGGQEMRYIVSGAGTTVVYFDEDGDGLTDATLYLAGVTGGVSASDFVL